MIDLKYAECIATILLDEDGNKDIIGLRFDAMKSLRRIAQMYIKEGFLLNLVEAFFAKKSQMILKAKSKSEIEKILKPSIPYYHAGRMVPKDSPYYVEEEELILWSRTSFRGPLNDAGYNRYLELFQKLRPEQAKALEKKAG